jgi:hypothetical protein
MYTAALYVVAEMQLPRLGIISSTSYHHALSSLGLKLYAVFRFYPLKCPPNTYTVVSSHNEIA